MERAKRRSDALIWGWTLFVIVADLSADRVR